MKKTKGAVTVFLIIVLFSTTLFGGLFIDATRVLLAKRYVRNALDSSARSALSYYDVHMASEYGLFAVEEKTAEENFKKYFKTNMALSQNDGFDILKMNVQDENISVAVSGSLAENEQLLAGMKDYSKYRSVVNTAVGVLEKVKSFFKKGGAADKASSAASKGKDAAKALEGETKELSNSSRDLAASGVSEAADTAFDSVTNWLKNGGTGACPDKGYDEIEQTLAEARETNEKINDSIERYSELNQKAQDEINSAEMEGASDWNESTERWEKVQPAEVADDGVDRSDVAEPKTEAEKEKARVDALLDQTDSRYQGKKKQIDKLIDEAAQYNKQISALDREIDAINISITAREISADTLKKNKVHETFGFILGDNPDGKTKELQQEYENLKNDLELMEIRGASAEDIAEKKREMEELEETIKKHLEGEGYVSEESYNQKIKETNDAIKEDKNRLKTAKDEKKNLESKRDKAVKNIEKLYKEIAADKSSADSFRVADSISKKDQDAVKGSVGKIINDLLSAIHSMESESVKLASNVHSSGGEDFHLELDLAGGAMDKIDFFITMIPRIITLVTDEEAREGACLFTDYTFDKCTFLTSQNKRPNRHFGIGEVEYILYGHDAQIENVGEAVVDIAMLRLMINWVDYMCRTHSPGIVSRMLVSLGRAAIRTLRDMRELLFTTSSKETASCGLCPSLERVRLTYSDHLRLQMLLKYATDADEMLNRARKMMECTYEVQDWGEIDKLQTYISGSVTVEVDLVMLTLPMFESVLPKDNPILQNGKFLVHESVCLGY